MKKILMVASIILLCSKSFAQNDPNLGIIPVPVSITKGNGNFTLDKTVVMVSEGAEGAKMADLLNAFIVTKGGFALREVKNPLLKQKSIVLTSLGAEKLPNEGYTINITPTQITLIGKGAGLFYAVQTVMQMLPDKTNDKIIVPTVIINDYPRFSYRGSMLDVGRHFFPVAFIKQFIDRLAFYKINNFHWHLTEDQGWRIEIKKYPKLTSVGSARNGTIIGHHPGIGNTSTAYKGFYTQEEAKEIVKYATDRYINVIPEIEMPGHSSAAIAAYPELSCFPDSSTYIDPKTPWWGSRKGKQVQQTWGVFDDVYTPTENTFIFLQNVLDEVMAIFPSKYIHIGGDESPKKYWKESRFCQALMKEKGFKDEHELQSYFIQRMEKYLNSKGRMIIGWDEILEGGLAPNATVMSWRGESGGIAAAQQNHNVIMTPGSMGLYIDHNQSNSNDEPVLIGGLAPYTKSYMYDPVPKVLTADQQKYILGVQANLWTEYITSPAKAEYQAYPRLLALSEIAWSPVARKDLQNFAEQRLPKHLARMDKEGVNFWVPTPIGQSDETLTGESFTFAFKVPVEGGEIYYSLDESRPSENATLYTSAFKIVVPKGEKRTLKTIVIAPSGRRSVMKETILNNGYIDPNAPKKTK
ncbi:beta-N-acetylhexosaminidase [Pedobacter changchengzhani]|uniref:beta-N-acetylhexosaminidase n=1 Tax=Pedobacter changchengzhani TaxID=2529274 RepID=A0A4R5MJD7_9SPHI|nr:family 20 glycosylhydrolase [Pedobacter changchengzhani]TDG35700.1 beta-N-acetylhexosaminidase [Pedobacter changchengzhani]